jgi:hypothetical protein
LIAAKRRVLRQAGFHATFRDHQQVAEYEAFCVPPILPQASWPDLDENGMWRENWNAKLPLEEDVRVAVIILRLPPNAGTSAG